MASTCDNLLESFLEFWFRNLKYLICAEVISSHEKKMPFSQNSAIIPFEHCKHFFYNSFNWYKSFLLIREINTQFNIVCQVGNNVQI